MARRSILMFVMYFFIVSVMATTATAQQAATNVNGHSNEVSTVCFTPDGKSVITGSFGGTVKLWNATTGDWIRDIAKGKHQIYKVAVDPTGRVVAHADVDGRIDLRDLTTAKSIRVLPGNVEVADQLVFVSAKNILISSFFDGKAQLWSVSKGKCLKEIKGTWLVVSADLKTIAKSTGKGFVTLINQSTGKRIRLLAADRPNFFSSDGKMLVTDTNEGNDERANPSSTIKVWDVATGKLLSQTKYMNATVAFDRQGTKILIIDGLNLSVVHVVTIKNGKTPMPVDSNLYSASSAAFSPDGKKIVIGGSDGGVLIWDIVKNVQIGHIESCIQSKARE